ncbi:MAG: OprO/OprP family phosphate-selective porin [Hyalangium sp.]|uniref:OprO/OprP family phosphate-selective porin n=1 Tax=Hyalangium sp. TaxID=2028555 RepID=UPI003899BF9D
MNDPRKLFLAPMLLCAAALLMARPAWADASSSPESSPQPASAPKAQAPGGASAVQGRDAQAALKLAMSLQADLRIPKPFSGLTSTFLIRRARLGLTGTLAPFAETRLIADFGQTNTPLFQDAWIDLRAASWLRLRAGRLKVPFGYEWLETSSSYLDFVEQSLVYTLLLPRYDQGLALHGALGGRSVEYWLGVFNEASSKIQDEDRGKMVAGRFSLSPVEGISVAVSGTHGLGYNLPEDVRRKLPTGYGFLTDPKYTIKYADGTSGLLVVPPRWRLGADATSYLGPTSLKVEYARFYSPTQEGWLRGADIGREDKRVHLPGLRSQAIYASGTVVLTGEKRTSKGVEPERPFDPLADHFGPGAWELGLRYGIAQLRFEGLSVNAEQDASAEQRIHELTAGLNWYLNPSTRWMFNFSRYSFCDSQPSFHEFLMRIQWTF